MSTSTGSRSTTVSKCRDELDYEKRVSQLESLGKTIEVDNTESIDSYYKGSLDMIKSADRQYTNNQLENAFISYLKFLDLFRDKIRQHADYKLVPLSAKSTNQHYQRHARLRVEELRQKLLQHYKQLVVVHLKDLQAENQPKTTRRLRKRDTTISKLNCSRNFLTSTSHTNPIDAKALDLEACRSLRTVVVPKQLPTIFQIVTQKITGLAFGVWAILAGQLVNNEYVVTHLIIPEKGSQNTVDFSRNPCAPYTRRRGLITLGWIHIHRLSSCYMSTTDMHAQWELQSRIPEAIGIVCSPSFTQVETYMLLRHGLDFIGSCHTTGMHAHKISRPLYTIARHAKVVYHLQFELVYLDDVGDEESVVNHSCHTW